MGVRRLALATAVFTAAACGVYTIVYLYRWEWHRALFAGLFFVAAEVLLATLAVFGRLTALERRLEATERRAPAPEVLARIHEAAPARRPPFAWLEVDTFGVFLPILLGAGVLASAAAWVVQSLARVTARPRASPGRPAGLARPSRRRPPRPRAGRGPRAPACPRRPGRTGRGAGPCSGGRRSGHR